MSAMFNQEAVNQKMSNIWEKVKDMTGLGQDAQLVIPHERGWAVRPRGASNPTSVFETKDEAIERARELAQRQHSELIIFNQNGDVQQRHSYKS